MLSFNVTKCHLLRFRKGSTCLVDSSYQLSGLPLTSVNQCRDLGIIFQMISHGHTIIEQSHLEPTVVWYLYVTPFLFMYLLK